MRTWAQWTARAAMLSVSFVAAGTGTAGLAFAGTTSGGAAVMAGSAGGGWHTSGNHSILGGNQIKIPIEIPVNVCGNALALLGDAFAGCKGGAHVGGHHHHGGQSWHTSGNHSILGGNQVKVPVKVPVNVCGNSAAALGLAASGCKGGAGAAGGGGGWHTSGNESILGGNQGKAAVKAPVNACGNALALLGDAFAGCKGGAHVGGGHRGQSWHTSGNHSILGGNQVKVPVKVPVNVCGNAAAVLGDAFAGCKGGATVDARSASHIDHANVAHMSAPVSSLATPLGSKSIIQQSGGALAGLSSLPVLTSLQAQAAQLTSYSTANVRPAQASLLSTGNAAPGMGAGSLLGLVMGALLAGAASLVAAGRRFSVRRASR